MKKVSTLFLKIVILLIATVTLVWMIKFPRLEGRAAGLDLISIYTDPLIIYAYIASIPFFVGLYQAFKLLILIDTNRVFSQSSVNALKNLKFASLSLVAFIALGVIYIRFFTHGDDPAGPTALGILASFVAATVATVASVFQKHLQGKIKKQ